MRPKFSRWLKTSWPRTQLIQIGCGSFLAGLLLAKYGWVTGPWPAVMAAGSLILLISKQRIAALAIIVLAFNLGLWRGSGVFEQLRIFPTLYQQEVLLRGSIEDDPAIGDRFQTEFKLTNLKLIEPSGAKPLRGRLQIRGFVHTKLNRGEVVEVNGRLRPSLGNYQGQISYGEVKLIGRPDDPVERVRRRFIAAIYSVIPEPMASLGLGFLIGTRSLLPDELTNQLSMTGLTHIVAVSGYNLTILVRFARRLLVHFSKYLATAGALGLIGCFLLVTGLSPSVVRAAIVSVLAILAWYYGRHVKPMVLILTAAAITAGINPTYLWYDIGWYLSFLAFFGVLVISPALMARIYKKSRPHTPVQLLGESIAAQLMTMPLIMYIFGQASPIALPANMLILPFIPLAMLLTLVAGLAGMFASTLAGWLAWPAVILVSGLTNMVRLFSKLPGAGWQLQLTLPQMLSIYLLLICVTAVLYKRVRTHIDNKYSVVE